MLLVAGDSHSHQNPGLLALSVVWLRYHNAMATQLHAQHPSWSDERLFHAARRRIIAILQVRTTTLMLVETSCSLPALAFWLQLRLSVSAIAIAFTELKY